jgi:hypothetical protein
MPRDVKPDFHLNIESLFFVHNVPTDETIFVFSALLVNRGSPSVALNWEATITVGDAIARMIKSCLLGSWTMIREGQEVTIHPGAELSVKTCEQRVPRGAARVGRLFFKLPGDVTEHLQPGRFKVEVSLEDYLGNKTSAVFGQQAYVAEGLIATYAHESSTVKDPEPAVPTTPWGSTTIQ